MRKWLAAGAAALVLAPVAAQAQEGGIVRDVGEAAGGALGATMGSLSGPVGTAVGGVVGGRIGRGAGGVVTRVFGKKDKATEQEQAQAEAHAAESAATDTAAHLPYIQPPGWDAAYAEPPPEMAPPADMAMAPDALEPAGDAPLEPPPE